MNNKYLVIFIIVLALILGTILIYEYGERKNKKVEKFEGKEGKEGNQEMGLNPDKDSPILAGNKKCASVVSWEQCATLEEPDIKSKCGYCEHPASQKYYFSDPDNVVTANQDFDPYENHGLLVNCENMRDNWKPPSTKVPLFNTKDTQQSKNETTVGTESECRKRRERELCAKATTCDHLGETVSDYYEDKGESAPKKFSGLNEDWAKRNCGFCPAGKMKGVPIVERADGILVPKYKEDMILNDKGEYVGCGGYELNGELFKSPISYIRYENNPNVSLNGATQDWNKGETCNEITGQNPCLGTDPSEWANTDGCHEYLFKTYAQGRKGHLNEGDDNANRKCTNVGDNGMKKFLGEMLSGWTKLTSYLPIKNALKNMAAKIESPNYENAVKYSNQCWGSSQKNPCNIKYVDSAGKYPDECKDVVYKSGEKGVKENFKSFEGIKNLNTFEGFEGFKTLSLIEGNTNYSQCPESGFLNYNNWKNITKEDFKKKVEFAGPLIREFSNNIKKKYNVDVIKSDKTIDYSALYQVADNTIVIENTPDMKKKRHSYYELLQMVYAVSLNDDIVINDLKNRNNVAKYIIKNVANLGCNGTLLNAMKYFPGEAPTCWEDFVVKMLITGKYKIKNKNPLTIEKSGTSGTRETLWNKLKLVSSDFADVIKKEDVFSGNTLRNDFPWWMYIHLFRQVEKTDLEAWFDKTFLKKQYGYYIIYDQTKQPKAYKLRNAFSTVNYKSFLLNKNENKAVANKKGLNQNSSLAQIYNGLDGLNVNDLNGLESGKPETNLNKAYGLAKNQGFFNSNPKMVHYIRNDMMAEREEGFYFIPTTITGDIVSECSSSIGDCLMVALVKITEDINYSA